MLTVQLQGDKRRITQQPEGAINYCTINTQTRRYLGEGRQVEMFVWQIEYDTSVDRFLQVDERGRVLHRRSGRLDHDLQQLVAEIF